MLKFNQYSTLHADSASSSVTESNFDRDVMEATFRKKLMSNAIFSTVEYASIEIQKQKFRGILSDFYDFKPTDNMMEFISSNGDIVAALIDIERFVKSIVDITNRMTLSILDESEDWKTIFINLPLLDDYKLMKETVDQVQDYIIEHYPSLVRYLNISF